MRIVLAAVLCILIVAGCGPQLTALQRSQIHFQGGHAADAEQDLQMVVETKMKDPSYPLMLLYMGSVQLSLGDYAKSLQYFDAACKNLTVEIGSTGTAMSMLKSESKRPYRGHPHEKVLAHTMMGLAYMQQGKLNEARIEFAQAREEDRGEEAGQNEDFALTHFLDGLNMIHFHRYDDAQVSFRKVTELRPENGLAWYALSRASLLDGDNDEAGEAWQKYEALVPEGARLPQDGSAPCAIYVIDFGWGPLRGQDALIGQFASWKCTEGQFQKIVLSVPDKGTAVAFSTEDLCFQAKTEGGLAGDAARKLVSVAAKQALKQVPVLGLFAGKSEADLRCWSISPGTVYVAAVPLTDEPTTVELSYLTKDATKLPGYTQVFYYVGGRPFDRAQVIYARALLNPDNREIVINKPKAKKSRARGGTRNAS